MKLKFENWFRIFIFLLAIFLTWTVWRAAGQTNPAVAIVSPADEQRFNPGKVIPVEINSAFSGTNRLEFVSDGQVVIASSNVAGPYYLEWSNAPVGTHRIAARITRADGQMVESPAIL